MKTRIVCLTLAVAWACAVPNPALAKPARAPERVWTYTLLEGSYLLDDCPVCDRPSIPQPMRGTFELALVEEMHPFARYELRNLAFAAGSIGGRTYKVAGGGTYSLGGETWVEQNLTLEVHIDDGLANQLCYLTNSSPDVTRGWPILELTAIQTNGTFAQVYHLTLVAAPVREIWVSTASGLTPGAGPGLPSHVSPGDLLSSAGRVVRANAELTRRLGIMPLVPDLGLDAVDILPGGEVVFSLAQDMFSETLGPLHHGDLLSEQGRIVHGYQDLISLFAPQPPVPDVGLDAVQVLDNGEVYFSIEDSLFSEKLGRLLGRGDLLSDRGRVVAANKELLARFQPTANGKDFGLDALHVWTSGEIWFSVEEGFQDQRLGPIQPGDLLSNQGSIVFRNLELLARFAPLEDLADFGLDALFVVSDAAPPASAPVLSPIRVDRQTGVIAVEWEGAGRVFQLERAATVLGPFLPVEPISPDAASAVTGLTEGPQLFFRVRQW
ncbi:MAG: hypothetical protein HYY24_28510 [Verrucomicrobia bacterium]|nr:hypothetical protein [Verrucomicrobiota bacterium]